VARYLHTPLGDIEDREVADIVAYYETAMRMLAAERPAR
jgi:hypothetical protein